MEIKAIIFDLGGVYFKDGTKEVIKKLNSEYNIPEEILHDIYYGPKSWELRLGHITSNTYWDYVYKKYKELRNIDLKYFWYEAFTPDMLMQQIVTYLFLDKKLQLGIVSGNIQDRIEYLELKYNFSSYFQFKLYSFNTGFTKIDKGIYTLLISQLASQNIDQSQALFIDDNRDCLELAKAHGINTLLYKDFNKFLNGLLAYNVKIPKYLTKSVVKSYGYANKFIKIEDYKHWTLYLHENQCYLGRVYLVLKESRKIDFIEISDDEKEEFFTLAKKIKQVLRNLFEPDLFNYASLCNVFKNLHVHIIPRYKTEREFNGATFTDKRWGTNYTPCETRPFAYQYLAELSATIKQQLILH